MIRTFQKTEMKKTEGVEKRIDAIRSLLNKLTDATYGVIEPEILSEVNKIIRGEDDEVDGLYTQIYHELMMFVIQDPKTIERANWLLWVAHNLERLADRVTNICERTVFIATGELKELTNTNIKE